MNGVVMMFVFYTLLAGAFWSAGVLTYKLLSGDWPSRHIMLILAVIGFLMAFVNFSS